MNYSTELIEYISDIIKHSPKNEVLLLEQIKDDLRKAKHFILPTDGMSGIKMTEDSVPFCRLPYDVMVLEYEETSQLKESYTNNRRLLLIVSLKTKKYGIKVEEYKGQFLIISCNKVNAQKWGIYSLMTLIDPQDLISRKGDGQLALYHTTVFLFPRIYAFYAEQIGEGALPLLQGALGLDAYMVVSTLIALNARNVTEIKLEASRELNKQRAKMRKLPFYDYYVLSIHCDKSLIKQGNREQILSSLHQSARLHSVRGHFKRRNNQLFWWNSHLRGKALKGIIEKDYKLLNAPVAIA